MNQSEKNELFSKIEKNWGINEQKHMVFEECGELISALGKMYRGRCTTEELMSELADVMIMVEQMNYIYGQDKFKEMYDFKLNRLKNRMDEWEKTKSTQA